MTDFSIILRKIKDGDPDVQNDLLRLVQIELRELAAAKLRKENSAITLQASDLVNEAYIRLFGSEDSTEWQNRAHFFGAASEAMRRILIEHARQKKTAKRGAGASKQELSPAFIAVEQRADELLAVHDALDTLEQHDPSAAQLVKLRYFLGMKHIEAAEAMEISPRVADRLWIIAKTWLYKVLKDAEEENR